MKLTIALFGITKEIIGGSTLAYELTDGNDVSSLLSNLYKHYPQLQKLQSLLVAVNSEYAEGGQTLNEHDEIALIPPVSGG